MDNMGIILAMLGTLVAVNLVFYLIWYFILPEGYTTGEEVILYVCQAFAGCVNVYLSMGMSYTLLNIIRGNRAYFTDIFSCYPYLIPAIIASLFIFIFILILVLFQYFVAPLFMGQSIIGIYFYSITYILIQACIVVIQLKLMFYQFFLFDKQVGAIPSLTASWAITRGHEWELFGLMVALICVLVAGGIALLIGLLVAVPIVWIAYVHAYETLRIEYEWAMSEELDE